jgi:hypothetical protein
MGKGANAGDQWGKCVDAEIEYAVSPGFRSTLSIFEKLVFATLERISSMRLVSGLIFCLCLLMSPIRAASPEDEYLAARDKAISRITAMAVRGAEHDKELGAEDDKLRADLENRLRGILGDVSVKGFPGPGKINLDSLDDHGMGYGMLDGLVYDGGGAWGPRLVVTTRSLLDKWLAAGSRKKDADLQVSADLQTALGQRNFFSLAIGGDASFTRNVNLPLTAPLNVESVRAALGSWTQEVGPGDLTLIVTLIKGDKVYIGSKSPKTAISEFAACEAIWTQSTEDANRLRSAYEAAKAEEGQKAFDAASTKERGERDFQACWIERASREPFYPALLKEAQVFASRIAGK